MVKRLFDVALSLAALLVLWPVIALCAFLVWRADRRWPFYSPWRMAMHAEQFRMHKLRSMVVDADRSKTDSTALGDPRITRIGAIMRRFKLDELPQLWNILLGDMSFVGPRPQIDREANLYTREEKRLLSVRPGITDFASIVFADLGDILAGHPDPNLGYNQLVRPWKSRLGLFYVGHHNLAIDIRLIILTALCIVSRQKALRGVAAALSDLGAPPELVEVALREKPLVPAPPPGADEIVQARPG
jgi:lipopolysaccharide/colanic/teichoic acid biosynthesis glycosyltransferase